MANARKRTTAVKDTPKTAAARKAAQSPVPSDVDPDAYYDLTMRVPHKRGNKTYSPLHQYKVKGWLLKELPAHKVATCKAATSKAV